jgi:hypothetical protein
MKKARDKRFGLARETIRELTGPDATDVLRRVVGGSCTYMTAKSTAATNTCLENQGN